MIKTQRAWPRYKTNIIDSFTLQLENLALNIARHAHKHNRKYVIGSGLAIDFYLGRISRNHYDIDFHPLFNDVGWWLEWFRSQGYTVIEREEKKVGLVYEIKSVNNELLVDFWPIAKDVVWKDENVKTVIYKNTPLIIEDPNTVLASKIKYANEHYKGRLRVQDLHDFSLMGQDPFMLTDTKVRLMCEGDYERVHEIDILTQEQYLGKVFDQMGVEEQDDNLISRRSDFQTNLDTGYCFVVECEGKIVGFMFAHETLPFHGVVFIRHIAVDPSFQGRGIGLLLYKQLIERAEENGVDEIRGLINTDNPNSIKLAVKAGFELKDRKEAVFQVREGRGQYGNKHN